jgi:hypothetical protein
MSNRKNIPMTESDAIVHEEEISKVLTFKDYRKKPENKKKIATRVWQFIVTLFIGLVLIGFINLFVWVVGMAVFVILIVELYYIVSGKTTLLDLVFSTKTRKIVFWTMVIIGVILAIYIPQKWGMWTSNGNGTTITASYTINDCITDISQNEGFTEQLAIKQCNCIFESGQQKYGAKLWNEMLAYGLDDAKGQEYKQAAVDISRQCVENLTK